MCSIARPRRAIGAALFDELRKRYEAMPILTDDYRQFVRTQLDAFERDNAGMVKLITRSLVTTAVVRPLVTVGLFWGERTRSIWRRDTWPTWSGTSWWAPRPR